MKIRNIVFFAVIVGIWGYWSGFRKTPVVEIVSEVVSEKPSMAPDIVKLAEPIVTPLPVIIASPQTQSPKKLQGNVIDFKVVDGLAVAYGDVLLGKPDPGFQSDHGSFEAPTPQFWEKGEVPYLINPELPNPKRVERALDYFRQHTGVRFIPYNGQPDAIVFESGSEHCLSGLGRTGGMQPIRLSAGCQSQEIMHEVMHALGFVHEQSRPDRDQFVEILWQNIDEKYQSQFVVVPDSFMEAEKGSTFDYHSIMIYQPRAFAVRPGLISLRSRGSEPVSPVQDGLSEGDIKRVNRLYSPYE